MSEEKKENLPEVRPDIVGFEPVVGGLAIEVPELIERAGAD